MGVRPAGRPAAASSSPVVPPTRSANASGLSGWLLVAIAASSMLAVLLAVAIVRTGRHGVHLSRARRV